MGSLKRSNFPAVLKHYLPDYEPSFVDFGPKDGGRSPRASGCRCQNDVEQKSRTTATSSSRHARPRRANTSPTPVARETTVLQHKKTELKRYRQNYENWQAAKAELKEENSRQLRQRIFLQQELIRKQDELSSRRQRELQDEMEMKRDAEKELKQSKTEALQQICRQSLDDDRQKAVDERKTKKKEYGSKDSVVSQTSQPTGAPTFQAPVKSHAPQLSKRSSRGALPLEEGLTHQPSMVAEEREEDVAAATEDEKEESSQADEQLEESEEPLPWHAEQLYKLYGRQADYFLKPKPEEKERKKTVTLVNPKQLRLRGRAGAGSLWSSFRNESQAKLLQQDMQISPDLKAAYSAFVRQCLSRRKKPVKRNFYAEEDVPEMDRLLDQSRILSVHDYKHMVEVMFRSSTMNQDRTGVLLHNNPPPNLNNWAGDESCGRYMPSWLPDYDEEEEEPAYTKHVRIKTKPQKTPDTSQVRPKSAATSRSDQGQGDSALSNHIQAVSMDTTLQGQRDQWEFLRSMKPKSRKPKTPKYLFLTEAAATVPGQFSKQRKELLEARHIPQAFNQKDAKAQSAMAMVGDGNTTRRGSAISETSRSLQRSQTEGPGQFTSSWQPLSLDALVEYKDAVRAMGQGDFNQGTVPRWSVEQAH